MKLFDRPYDRDIDRIDLDAVVDVPLDRTLIAAIASPAALKRRGFDVFEKRGQPDPGTLWTRTTAARQCDQLFDFEVACGLAFEGEMNESRNSSEETGEINAVLSPVRAALGADGPSRQMLMRALTHYAHGLWDECSLALEEVLAHEPESAEGWLLKAVGLLRVHDERGAREAAKRARRCSGTGSDIRMYATYLSAFLAIRAGDDEAVLACAREEVGQLGAESNVGAWTKAVEPVARELAFLAIKSCGRIGSAGAPLPFPTVNERCRALLARHPNVAIRRGIL